jgi:pSer/pThr/pTyr-binding forkhead associated (FHA) protein/class 3 adenylate cyclase
MRRFSLIITAPTGSRIVRLLPEGEVTLGRNPVCDIVLSEEQISRQHAKLSVHEGVLTIEDLSSNNGTFINGERISRVQTLLGAEIITIGSFQLSVSEGEATDGKRRDPQTTSNRIPTTPPRSTRPPSGISGSSGPNPTIAAIVQASQPPPIQQNLSQTKPAVSLPNVPSTTTNPSQHSIEELNPWSSEDGSSETTTTNDEGFEPSFEEGEQTVRLRANQVSVASRRLEQLEVLEVNPHPKIQESAAAKKAEDLRRIDIISRVSEAFILRPQSADKEMIDALVALFDADTAVLLLGEGSLEEMKAKVVHHREPLDTGEVPVSRTVIKEVIEQKTPIVTGDVRGDDRFEVGASLFLYNLASVMAAPLLLGEQLVGILYVNRWRGGAFEDSDLTMLTALANLAALAQPHNQAPAKQESDDFRPSILRQTHEKEATALLALCQNDTATQPFASEEATAVVASLSEVEPYLARLGPQRTGEVVGAWRERIQKVVLSNGGILLSLDGLVGKALFRHGDEQPGAMAALSAALQCRKITLEWFAERMPRLKIRGRFGVHSARCFIGLCGPKNDPEVVAVGEVLEGATHLEQAAATGEILASPATLAFVSGRFELGPIDPTRLAGASAEISQAFAVFGPAAR